MNYAELHLKINLTQYFAINHDSWTLNNIDNNNNRTLRLKTELSNILDVIRRFLPQYGYIYTYSERVGHYYVGYPVLVNTQKYYNDNRSPGNNYFEILQNPNYSIVNDFSHNSSYGYTTYTPYSFNPNYNRFPVDGLCFSNKVLNLNEEFIPMQATIIGINGSNDSSIIPASSIYIYRDNNNIGIGVIDDRKIGIYGQGYYIDGAIIDCGTW